MSRALEIAGRAVQALGEEGYRDESRSEDSLRPEKVISETAILLLAASAAAETTQDETRHDGAFREIRTRVEHVTRLLAPHARSDRVAAQICLDPTLARDFGLAHGVISRLGSPDARFDRLLAAGLAASAAGSRERLPHRELEQEWLARIWNPGAGMSRPNPGLAARSIIGVPLDALGASRDAVYAFTHALMFHTDLGARRGRLPRSGPAIAADAETALAWALDNEDYDLAGELLMTWPLLGCRWSAIATFGFMVLTEVEDAAGFLPSLALDLERFDGSSGAARTNYALATGYHTAYVMGLLCATALRAGCVPSRRVSAAAPYPGGADTFLGPDLGPARHWHSTFAKLGPSERDALAPMLVAIALRRAASHRDLAAIHALIERAARHGLPDTPAPAQAREFLHRAAAFGAISATVTS